MDNRAKLRSIVEYYLKYSCAATLARKHNIRIKQVFTRHGSSLASPTSGVPSSSPISFFSLGAYKRLTNVKEQWGQKGPSTLNQVLDFKPWLRLTADPFSHGCVVCGRKDGVEIHHLRSIAGLRRSLRRGSANWFEAQMRAINRKQAPLCKEHHIRLHKGGLTPDERGRFAHGCRAYAQEKSFKHKGK